MEDQSWHCEEVVLVHDPRLGQALMVFRYEGVGGVAHLEVQTPGSLW